MESNCQGPMLIRVSSIWKITQNHFVGRQNHYIHRTRITTVTQMENNCQGPKIHKHNPAEIIRAHIFPKNYMTFVVSRVKQYWKTIFWGLAAPPSPHPRKRKLTLCGHTHFVGRLTSKQYWKTIFWACLPGLPPTTQTKTMWAHIPTSW